MRLKRQLKKWNQKLNLRAGILISELKRSWDSSGVGVNIQPGFQKRFAAWKGILEYLLSLAWRIRGERRMITTHMTYLPNWTVQKACRPNVHSRIVLKLKQIAIEKLAQITKTWRLPAETNTKLLHNNLSQS